MDQKLYLRDAVRYLGLPCDPHKRTGTLICPACGRKTLRINFAKDVYNCPACEEMHGGILDFWALFRGIDHPDKHEKRLLAARDFYQYVDGKIISKTIPEPIMEEKPMAGVKERSMAYNAILDSLTLSGKHRQDLIKRGLTDADIQRLKIKTGPTSDLRMVLRKGAWEQIPGIYHDQEGYKSVRVKGYLIPQVNLEGDIQGCQIRNDNPDKGKYISYSSAGYENGVSSSNFVHVASKNYSRLDARNVIITEGPLKANVINRYTDFTVLAVPGVNSLSRLPGFLYELKDRGTKKVYIAYDMDFDKNISVLRGLDKLQRLVSDIGIRYSVIDWSKEYKSLGLKGFDDYLYHTQ